jgi:hypothetical protein
MEHPMDNALVRLKATFEGEEIDVFTRPWPRRWRNVPKTSTRWEIGCAT